MQPTKSGKNYEGKKQKQKQEEKKLEGPLKMIMSLPTCWANYAPTGGGGLLTC